MDPRAGWAGSGKDPDAGTRTHTLAHPHAPVPAHPHASYSHVTTRGAGPHGAGPHEHLSSVSDCISRLGGACCSRRSRNV